MCIRDRIHGIPFKRRDGTYIPLTETQKRFILKKDMEAEVDLARELSWDKKLKDKGDFFLFNIPLEISLFSMIRKKNIFQHSV